MCCCARRRGIPFRVKGITMSDFSDEELYKIHGNEAAKKLWLAKWEPSGYRKPRDGDLAAIRDFIQKKYIEKR